MSERFRARAARPAALDVARWLREIVRMTKPRLAVVSALLLSFVGCGSVRPLDPEGTAGSSATGSAGTTGAAGTTGSAGTTGAAGATGGGGASGHPPMNHRATATACSNTRAAGSCSVVSSADGGVPVASACLNDTECTAGTNGRCLPVPRGISCQCSYDTCFSDADCNLGGPCACRPKNGNASTAANVCLKGNCQIDADCGPGGYCSPTFDFGCGSYSGIVGYYCHTPKDACVDNSDCAMGDCRYNPAVGAWACATSGCVG